MKSQSIAEPCRRGQAAGLEMSGFSGSPPASSKSTRRPGSSVSLAASTQPADPAPTMTMSASVMPAPRRSIRPPLGFRSHDIEPRLAPAIFAGPAENTLAVCVIRSRSGRSSSGHARHVGPPSATRGGDASLNSGSFRRPYTSSRGRIFAPNHSHGLSVRFVRITTDRCRGARSRQSRPPRGRTRCAAQGRARSPGLRPQVRPVAAERAGR